MFTGKGFKGGGKKIAPLVGGRVRGYIWTIDPFYCLAPKTEAIVEKTIKEAVRP